VPALHLTPIRLYDLGFRGWAVQGVECVLPPLCDVRGGVFTMGSDKTLDKDARDDETPQYPVEVGGFTLGQHPVTVAEYACFVRAGRAEPRSQHNQLTWQQQLARLDHPVVNVSWPDAVAYVAWLAKTTGQPWRLPTEAEWEKAARWDTTARQARIYPWGDTFDKSRCNTRESGIGATTPAGAYPTGASPCGAQDMAGNVWEWTSTLYRPYPYTAGDGRESLDSTGSRVLRGGSWCNYPLNARAAYRGNVYPDNLIIKTRLSGGARGPWLNTPLSAGFWFLFWALKAKSENEGRAPAG
jgi:formylglycine-generating enzyme required for sulfatase activity